MAGIAEVVVGAVKVGSPVIYKGEAFTIFATYRDKASLRSVDGNGVRVVRLDENVTCNPADLCPVFARECEMYQER